MGYRTHYKMVTVDLSQPTTEPKEIFDRDKEISDVGVIELPGVAVGGVLLHLGQPRADGIPLRLEGQNFHVETEPDPESGIREGLTGGVYVTIPAGLGATTLRLLIGLTVRVER